MGKADNWIGPERIVMDTVRLYAEFSGTLNPAMDVEGTRKATEDYNAIKASKRQCVRLMAHVPNDRRASAS
jgi:hypothetical protein